MAKRTPWVPADEVSQAIESPSARRHRSRPAAPRAGPGVHRADSTGNQSVRDSRPEGSVTRKR